MYEFLIIDLSYYVGACALAPVMVVDGKYYDGVTPDSALEILHELRPDEEAAETTTKEAQRD